MITIASTASITFDPAFSHPARRARDFALMIAAAAGLATASGVERAEASGFALREQSGTALGNAFAGATAGAEDLSYMFFNPAGLTRQSGSQVTALASYILPQIKFKSGEASTIAGPPISGGSGGHNAADPELVPVFYGLWDLQRTFDWNQNVKLGLGVNIPFGFETDYQDGWIGRYHALQTRLETVNINPAVAYEMVKGVSLAAGLQVQYADAKLTNAVDFGTIGAASGIPGAIPAARDGRAKISGNDWGLGYNAGLLVEPWRGTRFGAAYRSAVRQEVDGDARFTLDRTGVGAVLRGATGAFADTNIKAKVTTPETVSFGAYQDLTDRWAVMGEAAWTRWSRFDDLRIKFDNPAQPNNVTDEDWNNTWFFALGLTYRPSDAWTFRTGVAYDQSPVPNSKRTPRIPDNDRAWVAIGAGYKPLANLAIDLAYTHIFVEDASINLRTSGTGNAFRGNLSGNSNFAIDIIAVQANWGF